VAIKKISNSLFSSAKFQELVLREIQVAQTVHHPNIVNCISAVRTPNNLYIITEFCDGITLEKLLAEKKTLPEEEALKYFSQIVSGYQSLFEKNVVHRDIKPANLIFNSDQLKICDLGFAKIVEEGGESSMTILGTPLYMSPQLLKCEKYTNKCDVWAMGFVFYEMLYGRPPWSGKSQMKLIESITKTPLQFPDSIKVSDDTKYLISKMLVIEEDSRIGWPEMFKHPLLKITKSKSA